MDQEITQKEKSFWKRPAAYQILHCIKEGKSLKEISEATKWKPETILDFISTPGFLQRLENHLKGLLFELEKNKVLALDEIFKYCWDIAIGKKTSENLTQNQAIKHLIVLLSIKEMEPKIRGIMETKKSSDKVDIAKYFGFEGLERKETEEQEGSS